MIGVSVTRESQYRLAVELLENAEERVRVEVGNLPQKEEVNLIVAFAGRTLFDI